MNQKTISEDELDFSKIQDGQLIVAENSGSVQLHQVVGNGVIVIDTISPRKAIRTGIMMVSEASDKEEDEVTKRVGRGLIKTGKMIENNKP